MYCCSMGFWRRYEVLRSPATQCLVCSTLAQGPRISHCMKDLQTNNIETIFYPTDNSVVRWGRKQKSGFFNNYPTHIVRTI